MKTHQTDQRGRPAKPITSGGDERPARAIRRPLIVNVADQATQLMAEPQWQDRDKNSITIATTDRLRVTLSALHAGAEIGSEETNDTIVLQALRGQVRLSASDMEIPLGPGQLATVEEPGPWRVVAETEALLLLTAGLEDGLIGRAD